jgi:hypothetical protein
LTKRAKAIHEKIGRCIEALYPGRVQEYYEVLAYHYSKSNEYEKAFQYQRLSGKKAIRNFSTLEGFQSFRAALETLNALPDNEHNCKRKLEILTLMTGPIRLLGHPENSLSILQEGERLSEELGDDRAHAIFRSRIGSYYTLKEGNPLLGIQYSEECFQEAKKKKDIELIASTALDLCICFNVSGQYLKTERLARKLIPLLEETEKKYETFGTGRNLYSAFSMFCGQAMGWLGGFEQGDVFQNKALHFAIEIHDKPSLGLIELNYATFFYVKGDGQNAIKHADNCIKNL